VKMFLSTTVRNLWSAIFAIILVLIAIMQFEVQWHVLVKSWVLCGFMADDVLHAANLSVFHLEIVLNN
jgi:hypothetical protein